MARSLLVSTRYYLDIILLLLLLSVLVLEVNFARREKGSPSLPGRYDIEMLVTNWLARVSIGAKALIEERRESFERRGLTKELEPLISGKFV